MQRDMDLVRGLLLDIEKNQNIYGRFTLFDHDFIGVEDVEDLSRIQYHLRLMLDAGYIEGHDGAQAQRNGQPGLVDVPSELRGRQAVIAGLQGNSIAISRMTWDGHEFHHGGNRSRERISRRRGHLVEIPLSPVSSSV